MTREERDKIGRNDWPDLSDAVLRELRDFKSQRIDDLIIEESATDTYQDFGICVAIGSLQHEVKLLNDMLAARAYTV